MKLVNHIAHMIEKGTETKFEANSRRAWLKNLGMLSAGGAVLVACGVEEKSTKNTKSQSSTANNQDQTQDTATTASENMIADAKLLNAALSLEHEAIALYTAAAGLSFMKAAEVAPILAIATTFVGHHISHRDSLISAIKDMQKQNSDVADPVSKLDDSKYLKSEVVSKLTDAKQVVRLASLKEMGAANAYLGLISSFKNPALAQVSGMLGGEEAGHYGALRAALFAVLSDSDVTAENLISTALPSGWKQNF